MFFRSTLLPIVAIMAAMLLSFSAQADIDNPRGHGMDTIVLKDANDVPGAVTELISELERQGFTIALTVNHSGAAASVNLDLAPNQVIFARLPRALERRLLRKSKTIGLDLPLKFSVFEDTDGTIKLSVNTLGYLIDRHNVSIKDFVLKVTDKLIGQFGAVAGEGHGLVSVASKQSFEDTVQALQDAISVNPAARIPLVLDYGKSKKRSFRRHRYSLPVLIVFGNPNVGTPLMQADPRIGIDLPLKFLVWKEDHQNQVMITYNNPHFLAGRISLQGQNDRLDAIANALNNLALAGAGSSL